MSRKNIISVFKLFGTSVHTRESSGLLMNKAEKYPFSSVEFDFSKVNYISRSFADQFYFDKINLAERLKKNIIITNANEEVVRMINIVSKTQKKEIKNHFTIPVLKFTSKKKLEDFFLNI